MSEPPMMIGCIPLWAMPTKPDDQVDPVEESCPECGTKMWVSAKKRTLRDMGVPCMCMECLVPLLHKADGDGGYDIIDIGQTQQ